MDISWGVVCSTSSTGFLKQAELFGKWLTHKIGKNSFDIQRVICFADSPAFVTLLEREEDRDDAAEKIDECYSNLYKKHPDVMFMIHILPGKHSPELEKLTELARRIPLVIQPVLMSNAYAGCQTLDRDVVFETINNSISKRFSAMLGLESEKQMLKVSFENLAVSSTNTVKQSYLSRDIRSTVEAVLHAENVSKLVDCCSHLREVQSFVIVRDLPKDITRNQVGVIFGRWPVASVLLTTFGTAVIDFLDPEAPYEVEKYYKKEPFLDIDDYKKIEIKVDVIGNIDSVHINESPSKENLAELN